MAVGVLQTLAIFNAVSGVLEDRAVHTWHFQTSGAAASPAQAALVHVRLNNFYNNTPAIGIPPGRFMAQHLARTGLPHQFASYFTADLTGNTSLGSPVLTSNFTLPAVGGSAGKDMPSECAMCLSFHGDLTNVPERSGNTRPASRRRGRIYYGPLTQEPIGTTGSTNPTRFDITTCCTALAQAATALHNGDTATEKWCVWSRADAATYPVTAGYIDNAVDIQRRRGEAASARVTW